MKFIADKTVPYLKGILDSLADITYLSSEEFTPEHVRDADALIVRSIDKCTRELLQGSRVKLITSATIGFDHIDTHYCEQAGIVWRNAPGCNARSVAQYVLAGLVARSLRLGDSLQGKTMGIVGVGHVGKELEIVCHAYGMRVLRNDPPRAEIEGTDGFVSLETLAEEADIISFHTPLTREGRYPTFHLADDAFFNRLQKKPCIINAARGAIIDTSALLKASQSGRVGDLIIDCWEGEPHINRLLLQQAYIATPHIAGFSADGKANGTRTCLEQIASLLCRAGFLVSLRGACGGYKLAFPPEEYKISMILGVTEESLKPVQCISLDAPVCSRSAECKTLPLWKGLYERVNQYLDSYTLKDLLDGNFTG